MSSERFDSPRPVRSATSTWVALIALVVGFACPAFAQTPPAETPPPAETTAPPAEGTPPAETAPHEPTEAELEEARTRFRRGLELARAGNCPAAVIEFEASIAIMPRPNSLFNLAVCEEELFRYDLAVRHYEQYLSIAPSDAPDRPQVLTSRERLAGMLGTIVVRSNVEAEVWIGDRIVGRAPGEVLVPGGRHRIELQAPGYIPARRAVDLPARGRVEIEITLETATETNITNTSVTNVTNVTVEDEGLPPVIFWSGVGVTSGMAVLGTVFGARAIGLRNDGNALDPFAAPQRHAARDDVAGSALLADVFFGAAGAFAIGTAVIGVMTEWGGDEAAAPAGDEAGVDTVSVMPARFDSGAGVVVGGTF